MNPLQDPLDGFAPDLYLATLSEVAHSDGLHPLESELLQQHAKTFGLNLDDLPSVPEDLSSVPWATRVLVYRDALTLALADEDELSPQEREYLGKLAARMALPSKTTDAVAKWVSDYDLLLEQLTGLLESPAD